jgi:hypothetical protein
MISSSTLNGWIWFSLYFLLSHYEVTYFTLFRWSLNSNIALSSLSSSYFIHSLLIVLMNSRSLSEYYLNLNGPGVFHLIFHLNNKRNIILNSRFSNPVLGSFNILQHTLWYKESIQSLRNTTIPYFRIPTWN